MQLTLYLLCFWDIFQDQVKLPRVKLPRWVVLFLFFISATVRMTYQNVRQNTNSSLVEKKKPLNALDFGMKSWLWEPRLPTSLWGSLCCSASGLAYSWLPAVCPVDDIAFIQIFHPQDTTLQQDHNHPSNTLGQCVEQLFRVLGDVDQS